ncbi:MAG: hypothetical protein ABSF26_30085 [Thermoguttaceae bacterium]
MLALAAVLAPAAAPGVEWVGDVLVDVQQLPVPIAAVSGSSGSRFGEDGVSHGYVEYRVRLKNESAKDHTVKLVCPAWERSRYFLGPVASRTVRVTGGQEATVSLFEPPSYNTFGNSTMDVRVDGTPAGQPIHVSSLGRPRRENPAAVPAVLLSPGIPQDIRQRGQPPAALSKPKVAKEGSKPPHAPPPAAPGPAVPVVADFSVDGSPVPVPPGSAPSPPAEPEPPPVLERTSLFRTDVPVSQWSPNWLGYSCYDAILLTQREAEELPAAVQLALRRYVECGGVLWVHGRKVPDVFSRDGAKDGRGGFCVGLGRAAPSSPDGEPSWERTCRLLGGMGSDLYGPVQRPRDLHDLLVAETSVPVRGLFLLVLVFGVAIGPLNVWLLSRYRRRIWLWWNVPAISALTCLAVFCYSLLSEGWTSRGKTATLTVLDERCHRATTIGYVSYYCPLTPSGGLHFGADTEVSLLARHERSGYAPYGRDEGGLRFVDWSSQQHLTSGWAMARVPAYFQIRKNEDRRERLTIEPTADGSLKVVNALGADIRRLCVADAAGRVFEGRDIPAGAQRTLTPAPGAAKASVRRPEELRRLLVTPVLLDELNTWNSSSDLAGLVAPGGYVAVLDRSPFVEPSLAGADCQDSVAIVRGISKGADHER